MLRRIVTPIERARALDAVSDRLQAAVQAVAQPQAVQDALHGVWLGHPLHPALVQVPIGAFLSAAVLDLVPGSRRPKGCNHPDHGRRRQRSAGSRRRPA
jgi:hypothetical protein